MLIIKRHDKVNLTFMLKSDVILCLKNISFILSIDIQLC